MCQKITWVGNVVLANQGIFALQEQKTSQKKCCNGMFGRFQRKVRLGDDVLNFCGGQLTVLESSAEVARVVFAAYQRSSKSLRLKRSDEMSGWLWRKVWKASHRNAGTSSGGEQLKTVPR